MDGPGHNRDWYGLSRRDVLRATGIGVLGWSVLSGATAPISGQTAAEEWSQFRYDNANTGHAPENTGPVTNIERELLFETDGNAEEGGAEWSSPAVVDGTVYIGRKVDGAVYAIDADTGTEEWQSVTDGGVTSSPAVVDGTVYIGSSDDNVYALDVQDGTVQWSFETEYNEIGSDVDSSPTVVGGTVYVGSSDGNVYALDASLGFEQWRFETGDWVWSTPAVANGTVYVGSDDNNVYALDANDGTEVWSFDANAEIFSSPAVVDGTVYIGSEDNNVYALDADDGEELWSYETGDIIRSSPAVANGTVYTGSWDNNLYALDVDDGTEQWSYDTGFGLSSSPAVVNNTVYVGDYGGVVAVSANDGTERWKIGTGETVSSSPAVANGTVYFGAQDSNVYAVTGDTSTPEATPTPTPEATPTPTPEATPTPTPEATPTPTPEATPTPTPTPEDEEDVGIIPLMVFGLLGLGGGGAWWLTRGGGTSDSEVPTDTRSTGTTAESPSTPTTTSGLTGEAASNSDNSAPSQESATEENGPDSPFESLTDPSADTGLLAAIDKSLKKGDDLRDTASDYREAGEYELALETYDKVREAYEEALDTANESNLINTDKIEQKLTTIEEDRREIHRRQLQNEVESIRLDLDHADTLTDSGDFDKARKRLSDFDSRIKSVIETATNRNFEDLRNEITTLEKRCNDLRDKISTLEKQDRLAEKIATVRSELNATDELIDAGKLEEAQKRLDTLESRLLTARETAAQHGFDDLLDEIETLKQQREKRLTEVTEQVEAHPIPDNIPRAPNISVTYNALTNKEPIGAGGNADVTRAILPTPDGKVKLAIKEPRMSGTLHTETVERMLEEAEMWDKLDDHDHIVGVVDYGSEPIPWIAMEYMDAGHLGDRSGELDMAQALWTAIAVTKGVRHAHRRGIAHLDLKPQNVLFRAVDDAWDVPKVADWGLSKHLLNHSNSVEGITPEYAAPEQFEDEYGPTDDITDIYQLGALFYELFTGQPPFEGRPTKVMRAVLDDRPTPPTEIADVPDELDEILLTALAKEKVDRYDNVAYLRDELEKLFDDW
jgi:outer membrane protein assembly factor BamB/tetratricopeptide (TPR) repeat protein